MKIPYSYSGKKFDIRPFKTSQEREILLLQMLIEPDFDGILDICGAGFTSDLTHDEKIAMLYKYREVSVGEEINLKFICKHCSKPNENSINISDSIISSDIKNKSIVDRFKRVTTDNIQEFIDDSLDFDDMDIDESEKLIKEIKETVTRFNFSRESACQSCQKPNIIKIDDSKFVLDNMSDDTLMSLYQNYNDFTFFGKYTKADVDNMYPFERTILISLLDKTREELNK